jgi:hypothetical protein
MNISANINRLFADAAHRTICRSKDCCASVTKPHFGGNPQLIYFQKSNFQPLPGSTSLRIQN